MSPGVSDYVAEKRALEADLDKAKAALRELARAGTYNFHAAQARALATLKELDE